MDNVPTVWIDDEISYFLHDLHHEPKRVVGKLLKLVYDIPYFGACGVFPPLHVANQWFAHGGGDAGMSPGASWKPFSNTKATYNELVRDIEDFDPFDFPDSAEIFGMKFLMDTSFDHIQDRFEWAKITCEQHRDGYLIRRDEVLKKGDWRDDDVQQMNQRWAVAARFLFAASHCRKFNLRYD